MIRTATIDDIDECIRLFNLGKKDHPKAYENVPQETIEVDVASGRVLVGIEDGRIVGMVSSISTPHATMLYMLVVDNEFRGRKFAPELIKAVISRYGRVVSIIVPHARTSFELAGMKQTGLVMENDS